MNAAAGLPQNDNDGPLSRDHPHNEEAEQAFLGALLMNNEVLDRAEGLRAEHFYVPVHGRIFEAAKSIVDRGQIASPTSLKTYFERDEALADVGGAGYLARLGAHAGPVMHARSYAAQIMDLWARREIIVIADEAMADAYDPQDVDDTADRQIERVEQALYTLAEQGRGTRSGPRSVRDVTLSALQIAEKAYQRPGGITGIATGLTKLDEILGGLQNTDLIVLAARPAMGKSALAVNIAFRAAQRAQDEDGGAALFFSLEMGGEQLAQRLLAELSGIPSDFIRKGEIKNFERLIAASQAITQAQLIIDDTPALTIAQLRARARRMKRQHGIKLIVVDYLQLVAASFRATGDSRVAEVSEVSRGLKALAKELDVPVLALSQLSRDVEKRNDKRPLLSDLRDSGTIEQDADVVIFLYREEYYLQRDAPDPTNDPDRYLDWRARMDKASGRAELIVAKQRQGPTGTVNCRFHGSTTTFSDLEE